HQPARRHETTENTARSGASAPATAKTDHSSKHLPVPPVNQPRASAVLSLGVGTIDGMSIVFLKFSLVVTAVWSYSSILPLAPFIPKDLKKAQRTAKPGRAMPRAKAARQGLYPKHVWNVIIYYNP
ncbi:MAG: hypothetical protein J0I26_14165, partial [Alphaproteobacteria bacterium]|nr:hypothetical protein [Alphaproteobacteria bacterium]